MSSVSESYLDESNLRYRLCVGVMLFDHRGYVFLGRRRGYSDDTGWQMPQGGIEPGERPIDAVFREMHEEIGTQNAQLLAEHPEWLIYEVPQESRPSFWKGLYCGQRQKWFALRFLGKDSDIQLEASKSPEFSTWRWEKISNLMLHSVSFKHGIYKRLMSDFESFARPVELNQ